MCNLDIRRKAKEKNIFLWQIAAALGFSEPTMTRKMRRELSEDEKKKFLEAIDKIAANKNTSR